LKEVFTDPLLVGELPGDQELIELAEAAPNASAAVIKLFRAYREQAERLSDLMRRRFDRHSMRLFISERLSAADQAQEVAIEVAALALSEAMLEELEGLTLSTQEARRIARFELPRHAALALTMPYAAFFSAAQGVSYDIDILRARFNVSFAQAAMRLTMLQRPGASALPFFAMEIDGAGHRLRRLGGQGFPHVRFGGDCPKLNVHVALLQPGQILAETSLRVQDFALVGSGNPF
jgi:predicted transcriptional regulator